MYRFFGKYAPRPTRCCVTRLLVTVSEMCVQYFVNCGAFEMIKINERNWAPAHWINPGGETAINLNEQAEVDQRPNLTKSQWITLSGSGITIWDKLFPWSWQTFQYSNDWAVSKYPFLCRLFISIFLYYVAEGQIAPNSFMMQKAMAFRRL